MIGSFDQRYEIQKGTETTNYEGTTWTWATQETLFGKEVSASGRVREIYQSLNSEVESIIKLNGDPTLEYDDYRLKRVSDNQIFEPTAPPTRKGEFSRVTYIGVKRV